MSTAHSAGAIRLHWAIRQQRPSLLFIKLIGGLAGWGKRIVKGWRVPAGIQSGDLIIKRIRDQERRVPDRAYWPLRAAVALPRLLEGKGR